MATPTILSMASNPSQYPYFMNGDRLSMPLHRRFAAVIGVGFTSGLLLGLSHGSTTTGLRFRAENAHRLPQTSTGWYLYHKSKNYHVTRGAVKEGIKMGARVSFWVGGLFTVEEMVDQWIGNWYPGQRTALSTTVAGLSVAGVFSAWNRFPLVTTARMARMGLLAGLAFGIFQDALSLTRGNRLAYIDILTGTMRREFHQPQNDTKQ